jgi:hypothetical protein
MSLARDPLIGLTGCVLALAVGPIGCARLGWEELARRYGAIERQLEPGKAPFSAGHADLKKTEAALRAAAAPTDTELLSHPASSRESEREAALIAMGVRGMTDAKTVRVVLRHEVAGTLGPGPRAHGSFPPPHVSKSPGSGLNRPRQPGGVHGSGPRAVAHRTGRPQPARGSTG